MSAHTPGPWCVRNIPTGQRYIGPSADGSAPTVACVLLRANVPDDRLAADARLVAAAPDLLAALRTALTQLELLGGVRRTHPNEGQDEIHAAVLETIDAAIAKALMRGTP